VFVCVCVFACFSVCACFMCVCVTQPPSLVCGQSLKGGNPLFVRLPGGGQTNAGERSFGIFTALFLFLAVSCAYSLLPVLPVSRCAL